VLDIIGDFQYIQLKTGTIEEIKAVVDALNPIE
jgi:enoyl reductase-like protein